MMELRIRLGESLGRLISIIHNGRIVKEQLPYKLAKPGIRIGN